MSGNTFSASPRGSMAKAENVVASQKGVAQPRNGQERASTLPAAGELPFSMVEFQQAILVNYGLSKTDVAKGLGRINAGVISAYGSGPYNPVGDNGAATDYARMKFTLASLFLHFCAATGPRVLETYNGTPRRSGFTRVPDLLLLMGIPTGTQAGPVPYNSSVAFRYAHKRTATTGQAITSPMSNRTVATNRFVAAIGSLSRAGAVVTAVITPAQFIGSPFGIGSTITVSPGEANFPAGAKVLTGAASTAGGSITLTWAEGGAAAASTVAQELKPGTTGAIRVRATVKLPVDAAAADVIQLFKSAASSDSSIEPSADVYLCGEHKVTGADVIAGSINIDDYTPESVLQVPAYTNPSDGDGQGEQGQNFPPPLYLDAANFDARTFYLGTTGQQYMDLQILGVGGPDGIQDGDTISVFDGVATTTVFTFRTAPGIAGDVRLITAGLPGYNIAWTSFYLARAAVTAGSDLRALGIGLYGETSPTGFPGGLRMERTDYLQTPFQVRVSRPASWAPALEAVSYTSSFASSQPNGLAWGKKGQPEAVPVVNQDTVGVSNYYGRRCFGLKNSLITLKEGDGIWSLTGSGGKYNLDQISKANIIAPDCACVFFDSVWALTDQGILRISDGGGVEVLSHPIETELTALATALPAETYAWSFAVAYETERRVMFFLPFEAATTATGGAPLMKAYVFSDATQAWTGPFHIDGASILSGLVSTGHKLWAGIYDATFSQGRITSERKTGTYLDVADAEWANVLTTTAEPLVVQLATAGAIREGTGISQVVGGLTYRTKVAEALGGGLYLLAETVPWANGACTMYDPYPVDAQLLPEGSPGSRKVLTRLFTLYKPQAFSNLFGRTTLETDQIQAELEIDTPSPGFGSTPFGQGSFGNPTPMVVDVNPIDAQWVNAGQFFPGFKLDEVWCQLKLQGIGMQINSADAPAGRGK